EGPRERAGDPPRRTAVARVEGRLAAAHLTRRELDLEAVLPQELLGVRDRLGKGEITETGREQLDGRHGRTLGISVEPKDLLERRRTGVRHPLLQQLGHRVLPPRANLLLTEVRGSSPEIVRLEVPEDPRAVPEDRVVADAGLPQRLQHL